MVQISLQNSGGKVVSYSWVPRNSPLGTNGSKSTFNPGKKGWDSLSALVQRGSPLSPNAMLIRVMLPEAPPGRPTLIDGVGKDMTNGELGGFFKTMHCPKCPYNREHWDNCNKVDQVSQLFFSRIVGHLSV